MKLIFIRFGNEPLYILPTTPGTMIIPRTNEAVIVKGLTYFVKTVIHDIDAQEIRIILE